MKLIEEPRKSDRVKTSTDIQSDLQKLIGCPLSPLKKPQDSTPRRKKRAKKIPIEIDAVLGLATFLRELEAHQSQPSGSKIHLHIANFIKSYNNPSALN